MQAKPSNPPVSATTGEEFIPLCVPEIRGNEWAYVKECLDTGWVSSVGSFVERFENRLAEYVGTRFAVATVNGTSALHIALLVAGVEAGDEVLVSALTFIAPANAVRYLGASPVFIDADPIYWQMDPLRVAEFLEQRCTWDGAALRNRGTGRRVKAIIPVHVLGHPVDLDPILELARRYQLRVIEDATEGLGTLYRGQRIGGLADFGCFSFNGNKLLTTGGGGMITTNNPESARRAKHLTTQAKSEGIEYIHNEIGYNYRLTNIQAALGCAQLEQVEAFLAAKRRIARRYGEAFAKLPGLRLPEEASWASSSYWMYTLLVEESAFGMSARHLLGELGQRKIQTRPLWQPMHRSPAHARTEAFECPQADALYASGLSLPCSVGLTEPDQERVIRAIASLAGPPEKPRNSG